MATKIGYFADGPWAHRSFELLCESQRYEIVFTVVRYDHPDELLTRMAEKMGIPVWSFKNVNDPSVLTQIEKYHPDLLISMSYNQIIRQDLFNHPPLGFINCHAGALPFYRGRNVLNWSLINGEPKIGVTVHFIDEGVDTGDLIAQHFFDVDEQDHYKNVLEKAYEACPQVLMDAVEKVVAGSFEKISQESIHPVGTYFPQRKIGDEWIDWKWGSERVRNFIRAISPPGPGARTWFKGRQIAILNAQLIDSAPDYHCIEGAVVGSDDRGITIKTGDSTLLITQVASVLDSGDLDDMKIPGLAIGSRFGSKLEWEIHGLKDCD